MTTQVVTYKDAGVDVDAGERAVELMKQHVRSTFTSAVLVELGTFGAMYQLDLTGIKEPVLISSADGVGTKLKVAVMANRHDTVGQDLVNHCVNDGLMQGARPLFFMDYFATGKLDPLIAEQVVKGLSIACKENGCSLIGGETAEMPDMYAPGDYDLAGFIVGLADKRKLVTCERVRPGDHIIGLGSNGLHTNGFSLARKLIFGVAQMGIDNRLPWGPTVGEELLRIHRSYLNEVLPLMTEGEVVGAAHITGGGLTGNLVRCLPKGCRAMLDHTLWDSPSIFSYLQQLGNFTDADKWRTFNDGVGMALIVKPHMSKHVLSHLAELGSVAFWKIGEVVAGDRGVEIN